MRGKGGEVVSGSLAVPAVGKIVIADEVASVRESLAVVLGREHMVKTVPSLREAASLAADADLLIGGFSGPGCEPEVVKLLDNMPPSCALLLLTTPLTPDIGRLPAPRRAVAFLPKPFDVSMLRQKVRLLLSAPMATGGSVTSEAADYYRRFLDPPFVPPDRSLLLRRVLAYEIPVLLTGERGTGKRRIAIALHKLADRKLFCHRTPEDLTGPLLPLLRRLLEENMEASSLTLYLEDIDRLSPALQRELLMLLDKPVLPGPVSEAKLSLIASSVQPLDVLVSSNAVPSELAHRLSALSIDLPPLRKRSEMLPDLVLLLAAEAGERLGINQPVSFCPSAIDRMKGFLWLGNLPELEAVISRTLVIAGPGPLEACDLVFTSDEALRAMESGIPGAGRARVESRAPEGISTAAVEAIVGQIAHELKNPMVTVKTFAQHIDQMLDDRESLARFRVLVCDAVGRMDELLEQLLEFARFREPTPGRVNLSELVLAAVDQRCGAFERRRVDLEQRIEPGAFVVADCGQLSFALSMLFDVLALETQPGAKVMVSLDSTGELVAQVHSDYPPIRRVGELLGRSGIEDEFSLTPIKAALAAAIIRRNQGSMLVTTREAQGTVVTVRLRCDEEAKSHGRRGGNGKA